MGKISDDPTQNTKDEVVSKFLTSFKKAPRKSGFGLTTRRLTNVGGKGKLTVPEGKGGRASPRLSPAGSPNRRSSRRGSHQKRGSRGSVSGSSGGSSGGGSDGSLTRRRKHRRAKKKDKKDTFLSRIRDVIAESDVFVAHNAVSPHLICIRISYVSIIPFTILMVWDLLAWIVFEIPHLSTIAFPGFLIIFQFVAIMLGMYGYSVQFVTTGYSSRYVTLAKFALIGQYILFVIRAIMEFYSEGFRYQEWNYIPLPWSIFPKEYH